MTSALVWLRRDLRLYDQAALHHALKQYQQVWVCFIFDTSILTPLLSKGKGFDRRVDFIWQTIEDLDKTLRAQESGIICHHGNPIELIPALAKQLDAQAVFTNHDYEPSAISRDEAIAQTLAKNGVAFQHFKDQVIFEKTEVLTNSETVFSVFTPYKNAWLKKLNPSDLEPFVCDLPNAGLQGRYAPIPKSIDTGIPSLESMGFRPTGIEKYLPPGQKGAELFLSDFLKRIDQYNIGRDFPATKGVSYLSTYLRFGLLSIRGLVREAHRRMLAGSLGASTWLSELIWRDFYFMILANHPRLADANRLSPTMTRLFGSAVPKHKSCLRLGAMDKLAIH